METSKSDFKIASFTKRGTRKLSNRKKFLRDDILPQYQISDDKIAAIINSGKAINLEIGFGSGEFFFSVFKQNPDQMYIGCEPFETGVLQLVDKIESDSSIEAYKSNIFIHANDVFDILAKFPNETFSKIYILFPDPWPKLRHHKRRIIRDENLDIFIAKLKSGSELKIATDHYEYASWIIAHLINRVDLSWDLNNEFNPTIEFPEYIATKYYRKAKTDDKYFFKFIKK
ncbi:hypothetical protein OAP83_02325 [Rickettsiales bacterium]|nr:hypothetical protein [Rickettsiales bacterium]